MSLQPLKGELDLDRPEHVDWLYTWARQAEGEIKRLNEELERISIPETDDFLVGVKQEAAYQRKLYGTPGQVGIVTQDPDREKAPTEWIWTLCYLATKAHEAVRHGDFEKGKHHTISSAALLLNWHTHLSEQAAAGHNKEAE